MTDLPLFAGLLRQKAADPAMSDCPAISVGGQTLTYPELADAVTERAAKMLAAGLKPGVRVALLQDRTMDLILNLLGAILAGIPVTVLSRREAVAETADKLKDAGFAWLVAEDRHSDQARDIARTAGVRVLSNRTIQHGPVAETLLPSPKPGDEALIIFTSGSSGRPKAVRISQSNIASNTSGLHQITPLTRDDRLLHIMPLSHTNGVLNQIIAPLAQGAHVILLARFLAEDFVAEMERHQPTVITGVPTIYQRLLPLDLPAGATARLRMARCGSAPLAEETHGRVEEKLGCEVIVSYGQTEATCTSTSNMPGARKLGSVGRPLAGQEVVILSAESDRQLAKGQIGEVAIRGNNVALGFVGQAEFNQTKWVRTGDCGYFDADGYLFLTGRLKEIIIRGGENLSPGQIEGALLKVPGISAACVCGVEDPDLGEVPVAFVETETGDPVDLGAANAVVVAALSPSHRLKRIHVRDTLPTNHVGKVDRRRLAREAAAHGFA